MIDRARVLITGANGIIGSYLDFGMRPSRVELDVLDREGVLQYVREHQPHTIVHLAAATDLDRCEKSPEYAYELNAIGTHNVASAARAVGAIMVFVSTSGLFNGLKESPYTPEDVPDPKNAYGRSKFMGEGFVQGLGEDYLIVRGCWIFGGGKARDSKFVGKVLAQLDNPEIKALDDVTGSPTYAKDFVVGMMRLLDEGKRGLFHINNQGAVSRVDVAQHITKIMKPTVRIEAVQGSYFNLPANRLKNEAMVSSDSSMRPWDEALTEYLTTEW